VKVLMIFYKTK